jgi:hypothetical protein
MNLPKWTLAVVLPVTLLGAQSASAAPGDKMIITQDTEQIGASMWTLTEQPGGLYYAVESGLGGAVGTARVVGPDSCKTLVIEWATLGGYVGNYRWTLNGQGTGGQGQLTWTIVPPSETRGMTFPSTITSLTRTP